MTHDDSKPLAVQVERLSRRFRGKVALEEVSLSIPVGSVFGLVGLNGAGKTTLIRHLIGLLRPQHGSVLVLGENPVDSPETLLKRVGYMTEEDSLPTWMRVGDMIDFARAMYPAWDPSYATELCDMFSLTRSDRLSSLSKGGRARAGLLVAIAHRPELLILDEPSSGLDPIARSDILEAIIRTISEDGRTVLFSSHLLDEVDRVCDSVALMRGGQLVESLTVEKLESQYIELICKPQTSWTAPPEIQGVFGWKNSGDEWSAVAKKSVSQTDGWPESLCVSQRRDISLARWFAASAGAETAPASTDRTLDEEATSDV